MALLFCVAMGVFRQAADNHCDVRAWGAHGDNRTDDTTAIQAAIDDCHLQYPQGAVVRLSGPAVYRITASIALTSNLEVLVDANTSLFSAVTPQMPLKQNSRCGTSYWPHSPTAVLCGTNLSNVALTGEDMDTSVIDGGGYQWYNFSKGGGLSPLAGPRLFEPIWTQNITISHLTFQNAAGWTIHPQFCDGILAHHIKILNPRWVGNTDGFDPDSCTDVVLHDALIDTGDDGISIKSGNSSEAKHIQMPSRNIHIYRTKILSRNFCVGSATYGGIENLIMEDCEIGDDNGSSPWAFKYKSHQAYAGLLRNHTFRRIRVGKIAPNSYQQPRGGYFLSIELRYHPLIPNRTCHVNRIDQSGDCPIFDNIRFEDIRVTGARRAGDISGFKGDLLKGLSFRNITFATKPSQGWSCGYVELDTFSAVNVSPPLKCIQGPAI